jgi:hypothetical protein
MRSKQLRITYSSYAVLYQQEITFYPGAPLCKVLGWGRSNTHKVRARERHLTTQPTVDFMAVLPGGMLVVFRAANLPMTVLRIPYDSLAFL